jgi:hypothetical protein
MVLQRVEGVGDIMVKKTTGPIVENAEAVKTKMSHLAAIDGVGTISCLKKFKGQVCFEKASQELEFINSNVKVTSFFKTKSTPSFQLLF